MDVEQAEERLAHLASYEIRRYRGTRLAQLGVTLIGIVSLLTLGLLFVINQTIKGELYIVPISESSVWILVTGMIVFASTVFLLASLQERDRRYKELSTQREATVDLEAVQDLGDILGLLRHNRAQMGAYDTAARTQAQRANSAALSAIVIGFAILMAGFGVAIWLPTDTTGKVTATVVAGIGTVTSGYIARTFLENSRIAAQSAMYYFQNPLVASYLLYAERIAATLPDEDMREQMKAVIQAAIQQADAAARTAHPDGVLDREKTDQA